MFVQKILRLNQNQEKCNISKTQYNGTCSTIINSQKITDYVTFTGNQGVAKASKLNRQLLDKAIELCNETPVLKVFTEDGHNVMFKKDELYENVYGLSITKKMQSKTGNYCNNFSKYTYNSETGEIKLTSANGYRKAKSSKSNTSGKAGNWNDKIKKYIAAIIEEYIPDYFTQA